MKFLKELFFILIFALIFYITDDKTNNKKAAVTNTANTIQQSSDVKAIVQEKPQPAEKPQVNEEKRTKTEDTYIEYTEKVENEVVITSGDKKYHLPYCRTIKTETRTLTVAQAKKRGYKPCRVCDAPTEEYEFYYAGPNYYGNPDNP